MVRVVFNVFVSEPVVSQMAMTVEAETYDEAKAVVRASLSDEASYLFNPLHIEEF